MDLSRFINCKDTAFNGRNVREPSKEIFDATDSRGTTKELSSSELRQAGENPTGQVISERGRSVQAGSPQAGRVLPSLIQSGFVSGQRHTKSINFASLVRRVG